MQAWKPQLNRIPELVVVEVALVEVESRAEDHVGDLGGVLELRGQTADLVSDVEDLLSEQAENRETKFQARILIKHFKAILSHRPSWALDLSPTQMMPTLERSDFSSSSPLMVLQMEEWMAPQRPRSEVMAT